MARGRRKVLSCGAVVLRQTPQGWRFLLLRAFNHWDFPKGLVEEDEEPKQAALREVCEETTLDDLVFPWGEEYFETGPYSRGKVARYYLAETRRTDVAILPNPKTGSAEHMEFRWCSLAEARRLAAPRVREVIGWAATKIDTAAASAE
ncbi:MAG: NUDIX domain-containing protein [Gammaproteobacteria bacterium]|nr:MAG: NUDIX domain-containing protein [Gammaproteobacteria bacterium]